MSPEKESDNEDLGFKVVDRRREGREEEPEKSEAPESKTEAKETPKPDVSEKEAKRESAPEDRESRASQMGFGGEDAFSQFILSLATSAYMHLGLVPMQEGEKVDKNLPLAKQTIDILGMLETKTKGNRTVQEDTLIEQILSELRMRYVEEKKKS